MPDTLFVYTRRELVYSRRCGCLPLGRQEAPILFLQALHLLSQCLKLLHRLAELLAFQGTGSVDTGIDSVHRDVGLAHGGVDATRNVLGAGVKKDYAFGEDPVTCAPQNGVGLTLRIAFQTERFESVDNLRGCKGCARDDSREIRVFEFYDHSLLRVVGGLYVIVNEAEQQVNLLYEDRKCEEARNGARKEENVQVKTCYGGAAAY